MAIRNPVHSPLEVGNVCFTIRVLYIAGCLGFLNHQYFPHNDSGKQAGQNFFGVKRQDPNNKGAILLRHH